MRNETPVYFAENVGFTGLANKGFTKNLNLNLLHTYGLTNFTSC